MPVDMIFFNVMTMCKQPKCKFSKNTGYLLIFLSFTAIRQQKDTIMGFIHLLAVNKQLNVTVDSIHIKFHRMEDLINGYRGVNSGNFAEVNTLISSISRDIFEMQQRISRLDHAEASALLLKWTDGRKYSWPLWASFANMSITQAKVFVNQYQAGYYR